jgi:hypothetical protein
MPANRLIRLEPMIPPIWTNVVKRIAAPRRPAAIIAVLGLAIAAPVVVAASSGPVRGATYTGSVGPGYPLSFHVSANGRSVESLSAGSESTCLPGPPVAPVYHFPTMSIRDGSFSGRTSESQGKQHDVLKISGHFTGKTVSGTLVERISLPSITDCTTTLDLTATAH